MPTYNHDRYLEHALRAHLVQRVPPDEVIVVDDASTDSSGEILARLAAAHPAIRVLRQTQNRGVNQAVAAGLREARGEYVCLSAADDLVASELIARSVEILARHPAAAFSFCDQGILVGDSGETRRFPLFLSDQPCFIGPGGFVRLLKRNAFTFASHSVIYRREALVSVGGVLDELRWLADWFALHVLALRRGACYIPETLAFFRVTPGSYSAAGPREASSQRDVLQRAIGLLETTAYRDVRASFRECAVLPEYRLRIIPWLITSPPHRSYVTPRLLARVLLRSAWRTLMPWLPIRFRWALRWIASAATRRRLARDRAAPDTRPAT
jgi:glycosyltransferase involved in cell wall biosynthesis